MIYPFELTYEEFKKMFAITAIDGGVYSYAYREEQDSQEKREDYLAYLMSKILNGSINVWTSEPVIIAILRYNLKKASEL